MFLYLMNGYWKFSTTMRVKEGTKAVKSYKNSYPHHHSVVWTDFKVKAVWDSKEYPSKCEITSFSTNSTTATSITDVKNESNEINNEATQLSNVKANCLPIYIGGSIALLILINGLVLCCIFVQYPYCKISNWFGRFLE
eukprot:GFUD01091820.1.p1 GENE.GFUD01091820.1~~GFUD01091820.1.p1  ORF type:complete len:152 (-),score=15.07 GFUD01091820.1:542-958(-)